MPVFPRVVLPLVGLTSMWLSDNFAQKLEGVTAGAAERERLLSRGR